VIGAGSPDRRAVALVFEVGEGADDAAPAFLATLRAQRVRATFAVTGRWAEAHRDLLISIAADGHQIVNGTYDGASFTGTSTGTPPLSPSQRALELSRAEVSVYHFTQRSTRPYFFPPYGDVDGAVLRDAAAAGYTRAIVPALDSRVWRAEAPADLDVRAVAAAHPGAIFLLHIDDQSPDADALAGIIDGLRGAGYALETVDELVAPP
jgi:peptidoglycan/xylan/chitin deacetylase (PgdA/CDA1 family)